VAGAALAALMVTGPDLGLAWDEGYTIRREWFLDDWFTLLVSYVRSGGRQKPFSREILETYWRFSRWEPDGHPPFYALLGLAGWRLTHRWLSPLEAYRIGPMALAAATTGILYLHLARRRGRLAAFTAAPLLLLMPRIFANAHYAHYDMPMTCLWLLAQCAFVAALGSGRWAVPFGVALGLAAGTKFTGLFSVVPAAAWVLLVEIIPRLGSLRREDRGAAGAALPGLKALAIGLPVAVLTLYAIQPAWWLDPVSGPLRFVESNLTRSKTVPLPTLYFGTAYRFSLPWHNTLVLTAITTPLTVLVLAAVGIVACWARRRDEPWALIWPLSWGTLMVVRALPNAPGHDVVRLFLPSIASLAVLAGLGVAWIAERTGTSRGWAGAILLSAAAIGESLAGMARTYPYTDSYYNAAIGGLKGAERSGFELTYYWETTGPEFLAWVRKEAARGPFELCFTMDSLNHLLARNWGMMPREVKILDLNRPSGEKPQRPYFVQQRRRGLYYAWDRWLERHGHPIFTIRREGVDLLRVFTFEEFMEAFRATSNEHPPSPFVEPGT
jgi:hypothetical protein